MRVRSLCRAAFTLATISRDAKVLVQGDLYTVLYDDHTLLGFLESPPPRDRRVVPIMLLSGTIAHWKLLHRIKLLTTKH